MMSGLPQGNEQFQCPGGCCCSHDSPRRSFLKKVVGILSTPLFVFLGWPFVQNVVGTIYRIPKAFFAKIGPLDSFPTGEPVLPKYRSEVTNAYIRSDLLRDVWVIRHSDTEVTVFSPICPHLGCRYNWYPQARKFICPCHGSVFSIEGKVLGGPAPRGLDTLSWKIENGDLYIKWELFRVGIPQKIRIG
jgi:menaquinol-cytochrome c reductase iron-sulfur subunit